MHMRTCGAVWCLISVVSAYKAVVLGDIHGDYDALLAILKNNGVVDSNGNWADESTKVISVGDTIGRGYQDKEVLEFIKAMTEKHQWLQQLGNHEIMQLRGDWRYARDGPDIGFGSLEAREEALRVGSVLGDWMRSLPAIQQDADNVYIHAGMYDPYNIGRTMEDMNEEIITFLKHSQPRHVYDDLIWTRELVYDAYDNVPGTCALVAAIIAPYNANRLFIGHTPVQSLQSSSASGTAPVDPLTFCSETLLDVDVGISRWMYSNPVNLMLEIDDDTLRTVKITVVHTTPLGQPLVNATDVEKEEETRKFL